MTIQLVTGALLEHQPLPLLLALLAFALNGLLMLAHLDRYKGALQRSALTLGESAGAMTWDRLFVHSKGRTSREQFIGAVIPLAIVIWWYARANPTAYPRWSLLVLLFPAVVLTARRLHDMGHSGWLVLVPSVLTVAAMAIWDRRLRPLCPLGLPGQGKSRGERIRSARRIAGDVTIQLGFLRLSRGTLSARRA
jgi:Protein of unknown function (DUF805)